MNKAADCIFYIMKHADTHHLIQCTCTCGFTISCNFVNGIVFVVQCFEQDFELYEYDGGVYYYGVYNSPEAVWERMCIEHGFLRGGGENEK